MALKADDVIQFTFDQFYQHVDRYISRRLGIGLESLADVDIYDYWQAEAAPVSFWRSQVQDAASWVMENQDGIDDDILEMF